MDGKCQTIDAVYDSSVTSLEPRKIYFELAEKKNERQGIIITKSHSTINVIYMK